ncbi:hypothetical protein D6D02_00468 [Aureobasidium pullulans]|uniref:RBR-type E3 ubiquitin transferase n=1 Tax=Aureobasidium pullulans TaxID=5580 RepID=A0A4S8ZHE4_AURPU|nr:hypothetical protein D6D20_02207 [Aureobasidium pullulans]THX43919.1 hypothetical protein D6D10_00719 [Aureobasidium pullulans]THY25000.1 hypothetical protein D6D02_00468 [Aureobasidium pullulans]THZ72721.1 hypothetical protein D6C85_04515 [Aureobasidium pullulans]THZ98899.1 hypothetical protein D6C82_05493 [Aureobasidium pullulans]
MSSSSATNEHQAQMSTLSKDQPKEQGDSSPAPIMDSKSCLPCSGDEDLTDLPCGHSWCSVCIIRASSLVTNERHWPMACAESCKVPEDLALKVLPEEKARFLKAKLQEFKTPAKERCYCANVQCGRYIPPDSINIEDKSARCGECSTVTCTLCCREQHQGPCAGSSEEDLQMLDLIAREGYQQCSECNRVVERESGCPHMTCYCGYEFCYHCGSQINVCNGCVHKEPEFADLIGAGLEDAYARILAVLATRAAHTEADLHPNDHIRHLELAMTSMYATGIHTAAPSRTLMLNMAMNTQGYRGPLIYFDAQYRILQADSPANISTSMEEVSDMILWQTFQARDEVAEAQQEDDVETESREEQQAVAATWEEDWSM